MDDRELLREYVQNQSQEAFRELVHRHLPMVYSAARRMVGDADLAEEVAQTVFTTLGQKAGILAASHAVSGWLYNTTRHHAMHAVRTEQRRHEREQTAAVMQSLEKEGEASRILDALESAMAELEEGERDTLVLRYLEDRSLRDVARELGITEDAARMRVNRALEHLRGVMAQHGIAVTSVLLASVLASTTSTAIPIGLAAATTATALARAAAAAAPQAVLTTMTWFNTKAAAVALGAAVLTGTGTYLIQQRQVSRLQAENQTLAAQQEKLGMGQQGAAGLTQAEKDELEGLRQSESDLLRLRNEVSQLRREREADQHRVSQQPRPAQGAGGFIPKEQLANVGFATPEAALQSWWAAKASGNYDELVANNSSVRLAWFHLSPDGVAQVTNAVIRELARFEEGIKDEAARLKGMQMIAKKVENNNNILIQILVFQEGKAPEIRIEHMIKVGDGWRYYTGTPPGAAYDVNWAGDGQVQLLTAMP